MRITNNAEANKYLKPDLPQGLGPELESVV